MFDRIVLAPGRTRTEYVTREVHEHRAPTDKSVELLMEMEKAAKDKIVEAVHVKSNDFECVVHQCRHFEDMSHELVAVMVLNGKKITVSERGHDSVENIALALRDKLAREIASRALGDAFRAENIGK